MQRDRTWEVASDRHEAKARPKPTTGGVMAKEADTDSKCRSRERCLCRNSPSDAKFPSPQYDGGVDWQMILCRSTTATRQWKAMVSLKKKGARIMQKIPCMIWISNHFIWISNDDAEPIQKHRRRKCSRALSLLSRWVRSRWIGTSHFK